jgi:YHS domain-containing protein
MSNSTTGSCCSHVSGAVAADGRKDLLARPADEYAECPVMVGSTVIKADAEAAGLFRDYDGTRYYFCCAGCGPAFDADPAKYVTAAV